MGNIESSQEGSLSRRSSNRKSGSQSPPLVRRTNSFRRQNGVRSEQTFRRSKTCRAKDRNQRPRPLCVVTGLTVHQKSLLTKRWNKMDNATLYDLGKRVFEGLYMENPAFLSFIGLSEADNWKKNISFRMHAQRFVTAICECLRRMRDPHAACDVLRDFGALYAPYRVPNVYFEKLAQALHSTAREFEESVAAAEHERLRSSSADPSASSSACDSALSGCLQRGSNLSSSTASSQTCRDGFLTPDARGTLTSRHSDSSMYRMNSSGQGTASLTETPPNTANDSPKSLDAGACPVTLEAWAIFSAFVANQIKLGCDVEKVLQYEMSKLGLNTTKSLFCDPDLPFTNSAIDVE